jgi:hypothetical protein
LILDCSAILESRKRPEKDWKRKRRRRRRGTDPHVREQGVMSTVMMQ